MLPILGLLFFVISLPVFGQVSGYTTTITSGTYAAIAGTSAHASGWDDAVANATIPFTFTFNGIGYTSCSINTNGYITFGTTASSSTGYTPISATTGYAGAISALARDLGANGSAITYTTLNTTPNRIFVIQWANALRFNTTTTVAGNFNFQIRLYETTNVIDLMYGACVPSTTNDLGVQVGLRGSANTDFKNFSLASGTGQWSAAAAGTLNTNTVNTRSTSTQYPSNGLIYRFTPPTCSGTPTPPTAVISAASGQAGTAFNLTYSGGSTGGAFSSLWQYSYDNSTWTDWGTNSGTPFAASAQSTLYARVKRTCNTSGLSDFSNVVTYTVTSWIMSSNNSAYACSGIFYDSGGSGGSYGNSQDYTYTFYPAIGTTGQKVRLTFTAFATENLYDGMMIYNGNSIAAPLLSSGLGVGSDATTCPAGSWRGSGSPGTITSTAADGSLTIRFRSDNLTVGNGWAATVSCFNPCTVPTSYSVTGGGARCTTGAGLAVGLSGSQAGLSYQLFDDGSPVGTAVAGTGAAISFGAQTAAGTYTVVASASGFCTTTMTGSVAITVDPVSVLGTLNTAGPVSTCDHLGNISQVTLSGFTGTPSWEYGDAAGNWYVWNINAANAGTCCFYPNPGADRIRVIVQSGACAATAYTSTVLIQNRNAPAPTTLASTATTYCLAARPTNITLTATFPATGDILPTASLGYTTVQFYSGACGTGTLLGTGTISGNTATYTLTAPSVTTTYYARSTSSCETSLCSEVTVTVNDVPAQPGLVTGLAAPCSGSSQNYFVTNVPGTTYTWAFPGSGWSITGGTGTSSITVTVGSGTGSITVTPSNGCGTGPARTFAVATGAGPTVIVTPSAGSACGGVGVSLTASGASTYSWSPSTGLSATTGATVTANPVSQTTYTVTETSSGCANTATVVVRVGTTVDATANVSTTAVCPGGAVNLTSSGSQANVTLLSGTGDGGFEAATSTPAANGWTVVGTSTPAFYVGTPAGAQNGTKAMFAGTSSASNSTTTSTSRVNHVYRDITIPAGYTNVFLNYFFEQPITDDTYEYFHIYTTTTANTPVAGTIPGAGYTQRFVNTATAYANFTAMPQIDLSALAGTTVRLVFTYRCDGASPYGNPAIDNISIVGTPPAATYSYAWSSSPAGFTSTSQNPTANPTVATTYTVTVTNTSSGCSDVASTATVNMNAVPQGSLTAGGTVCAGEDASLTFTATSGVGPFSVTYSSQTTTGVVSGTPFLTENPTVSGTNSYTMTSVTSSQGCVRTASFTAAGPVTVTGTAAATAPTTPTSSYDCNTGAVTLTTSGAGAGESYKWYTVASGGTATNTGVSSITVTPVNSTTYYAAKYYTAGGACESPRVSVTAWAEGLETYTASRATGIVYTDISAATAVSSWRNGTSEDDNLSNNLNIGFSFPYDGGWVSQFRVSLDGFITFNTSSNATGNYVYICDDGDSYSADNTRFTTGGRAGSLQTIAPFYDDLLIDDFTLNTSVHYQLSGSSPNRVLTVQWRGMSKYVDTDNCSPCSYGNYNFQVKLYETSGNVEFVYSTMTSTIDEDSKNYSCGLNSASLGGTLNTAKLFTQQSPNTATFSSTAQNGLTTVPATNSRITLTRSATVTPTVLPTCIAYNYPINGATNQCGNGLLSWSAVDGNPTSYDVYFGTSSTPPLVATSVASTYYNTGNLGSGTYYWRIVPKNATGTATATMPTWSFTTNGVNSITGFTVNNGTKVGNTVSLCAGESVTITLTGVIGEESAFEWRAPFLFDLGCDINPPFPLFGNCQASSRTFSNLSAGTYEYYVTSTGCNGVTTCLNFFIDVDGLANTAPTSIGSSAGTTICAGTSTVLTPVGGTLGAGATYEWFTGSCGSTVIATSSTITVSPTGTTTYFVRRTGGTTCANTTTCASQTITVQSALGTNTIAGTQTICEGLTATLTGSAPSGGSGSYTYDWQSSTTSASAGFGSLGSNTIGYTSGTLSQTTWFKRTVTSGTCTTPSESNVIQVTVTPTVGTPAAITISAGSEPSCQLTSAGVTTTYATAATNNTGYNWSLSNGAAGSINSSGVMTWTNGFSGTVDIRVTANGCGGPTNPAVTRTVTIAATVSTPSFTTGATTVCAGSTETYTATSTGTVTYSIVGGIGASINTTSGQVSSVTGGFTVRASAAGCNGPLTADRVVTVTPNVGTPSFTAGATTVCIGSTETYTATASNGTVTYSIVSGGASINTTTGQVSSVTSGFTVRATATGCNGPTTTDRIVTVTPNVGTPSFTAGASTVCIGSTETYTATASNGTVTYSIVSGGASINTTTGQVSSVTSGFTVRATATGCNGPTTTDRIVTVTPNVGTPSFTAGATTVCIGSTETYTATASNGTVTYSIVSGGASINTTTGQVSSVTSGFTVRATATGCNGPTTADRVVTVTGSNTPTVSISANPGTSICAGVSVTFTATPGNGGTSPTYQWTLNGSNVGTGPSYPNSSLAAGDEVAVVMTSNATCLTTPTASDMETISIAQPNLTSINGSVSTPMTTGDYLWAGNTSTNWTTASNWYVLNSNGTFGIASTTPTTATNVYVVLHTVAQQCVSSTANATISSTSNGANVTIATGATVTVTGSNNLNVAGNWLSQGTFTASTGTVTFTGSGNRTITSNGNLFHYLVVNKSSGKVTITDAFEATEELTVTNGTFETPSGITGTAKRISNATTGTVRVLGTGTLRVEP